MTRWALLTADPTHELRLLAVQYASRKDRPATVPGALPYGERLRRTAKALAEHPDLESPLRRAGLQRHFPPAVADVLGEEDTRLATDLARERVDSAELCAALARAFVARASLRYEAAGGWPPLMSGRTRDALVTAVTARLGTLELGVSDRLVKFGMRLGLRFGASTMMERRHDIVLERHALAGDVLHYLTRGQRIRDFIKATIAQAADDVVLVAHSLGGIASLDLLVGEHIPAVRTLLTVGSQGPLLYEIGSLPSLPFGEPLPDWMPRWVNVYDPRDALAYVGSSPKLFGDRIEDVRIDNGVPVLDAHSAYFDSDEFYDVLDSCLS
ncbi:lipase family protein [Streptomyces doebereineriae]|uniref:Uncharacterized protein n=1 Tax=Streptomyces doebereineriae TaxID=3075528 RepID=A0ABU2VBV3_9ACTN|nr:hypothetical protein [Streptomyces sp. DSM 41640]MDT0483026.1 hypothetical protein [Streptomyces sp. DSM 41640]